MPRLKTRLAEGRWHFLVLALLTERAISAGRARSARHANGHIAGPLSGRPPAAAPLPNPTPSDEADPGSLSDATGTAEQSWQWLREYFACDHRRALQTALGLLWLLDGALQFQPFMYTHGFIAMLNETAAGQPGWIASSMTWAARIAAPSLGFFNTLFALTQVAIGLGLLYRPTVKRALLASFGWTLVVWWIGEGFGLLFTDTANPLTGAPGAVLLYSLIGLLAWPGDRPGGLLSARGAKTVWAVLWLVMAWAWLLGPSSGPDATADAIRSIPSGSGLIDTVRNAFADAAAGNGLIIAVVLALASAAIGIGVALDVQPRRFLKLAIGLNLAYWLIGQGLGGLLTGTATDPNAGPVFVLLTLAIWPLQTAPATAAERRFDPLGAATGAYRRLRLAQREATPRQRLGRAGLAAGAGVLALVTLIVAVSGGSSSPHAVNTGSLASLDHLKPPGSPGPLGPEGLPVPDGPPLAAAAAAPSGSDVDGIPSCLRQSRVVVRRHVRLTIFVQGAARQIPAGIGITGGHARNTSRGTYVPAGNCFSVLHTDAADGMIQVESPTQQTLTLGNFFDVWGQPLSHNHVGPATGPVTVFVNGSRYTGNPRDIPFTESPQIQLDVGKPVIAPARNSTPTDI